MTEMTQKGSMRAALTIGDKTAGERVLQQVRYSSGRAALHGEPFPTPRQIACVLHALADHTHNAHMLSAEVLALGEGHGVLDEQTTALGRYFHAVGDDIESIAFEQEQREGKWG